MRTGPGRTSSTLRNGLPPRRFAVSPGRLAPDLRKAWSRLPKIPGNRWPCSIRTGRSSKPHPGAVIRVSSAVFRDVMPLFGLPFRNYVQSTYSELYLEVSSPTTLSHIFGRQRESIFDGSSLGSSMLRAPILGLSFRIGAGEWAVCLYMIIFRRRRYPETSTSPI